MTTVLEIAAVSPALVLVGFIVFFLLLFLLYRERRQPRGHTPQNNLVVHGDLHLSPTVKYVVEGTPNKSKVSDPEEEKSEALFKVSEEEALNSNEARDGLRHRVPKRDSSQNSECEQRESSTNVADQNSTSLPEENGQRVFSQPVVTTSTSVQESDDATKAFLDVTSPNSDKDGEKDPKQLDTDRLEGASVEHCSTTIDEAKMMAHTEVPTYRTKSPTDPFTFEVDRRGCKVIARYCKLNIPPDSITEPQTITMHPRYHIQARSQKEVIITPYVAFKTHDGQEIKFAKDVTLALYTGYSAVDCKEPIPVQVLWKKNSSSPFECVAETFLGSGTDKFISFACRHFCGYCIAAEQSHFHCMRRHYFFAGYVRDSMAPTRIFHWMVFDDCPATYDRQVDYLKGDDKNLVVMDPESFHVDYDYTLQMVVKEGQICPVGQDRENLKLHERWGSRVTHTHQFEISNVSNRFNENMRVHYKMMATHNRDGPHREVCEKHFFYEWKVPPPEPAQQSMPNTINVYGQATGIRMDCRSGEEVQHQESVDSRHSSGYGSPTPSSRTFSLSDINEAATPATRQDSGFNDQEEAATRPKSSVKPIGDPRRHSTPLCSRVAPETDRLTPNVTQEDPVRNSPILSERDSGPDTFHESPRRSPEPDSLAPITMDNSGASLSQPDDGYSFGAVATSDSRPESLEGPNTDAIVQDSIVPADSFEEQPLQPMDSSAVAVAGWL